MDTNSHSFPSAIAADYQRLFTKREERVFAEKEKDENSKQKAYALFLIESPGMRIRSGEAVYRTTEPCVLFLPPLLSYRWEINAASDDTAIPAIPAIQFDDWLEDTLFARKESFVAIRGLLRKNVHGIRFSGNGFDACARNFRQAFDGDRQSFDTELSFLSLLFRLAIFPECPLFPDGARPAGSENGNVAIDPRMEKAYLYIKENISRKIYLKEVAEAAHTSLFTLNALFNKYAGCTFTEYLNRERIRKACDLLAETDEQITAIAYDCGFQTFSHFWTLFRQQTGRNPTEFRGR